MQSIECSIHASVIMLSNCDFVFFSKKKVAEQSHSHTYTLVQNFWIYPVVCFGRDFDCDFCPNRDYGSPQPTSKKQNAFWINSAYDCVTLCDCSSVHIRPPIHVNDKLKRIGRLPFILWHTTRQQQKMQMQYFSITIDNRSRRDSAELTKRILLHKKAHMRRRCKKLLFHSHRSFYLAFFW